MRTYKSQDAVSSDPGLTGPRRDQSQQDDTPRETETELTSLGYQNVPITKTLLRWT